MQGSSRQWRGSSWWSKKSETAAVIPQKKKLFDRSHDIYENKGEV
jgi:hypothetical protein